MAKHKTSGRRKKPSSSARSSTPLTGLGTRILIWTLALSVTAFALIGALLLPQQGTKAPSPSVARVSSETELCPGPAKGGEGPQPSGPRPYEEAVQEPVQPQPKAQDAHSSPPGPEPSSRPKTAPLPRDKEPVVQAGPRLAVVIDDLGQCLDKAEYLLAELGPDLTWSVLPHSAHTQEVVQLAADNGLEYLLHVPMEPLGYPEVDPGPGSLFVCMPAEAIRQALMQDLEQVPGAVGANNHMGSRFTADRSGMQVVLEEFKTRGLFFMDSLTSPQSTVAEVAREVGVPITSRDIFLDNEQDVQAILHQLAKAERLARSVGQAVAIGHPYPETLTALSKWSKERDADVQLVRLSRLIVEQ